jgi:mercuric ion transport protein
VAESLKNRMALSTGALAALLASACCLGPLVLVMLGLGGAWAANLVALEPYRPWFIGAAILALFFAGRRIFRAGDDCKTGDVCAVPQVSRAYRALFWIVVALVFVAIVYPYVMPIFY